MYVDEPAVVDPDVLLRLVAVAVHGTRAAAVSARRLEDRKTLIYKSSVCEKLQTSGHYFML